MRKILFIIFLLVLVSACQFQELEEHEEEIFIEVDTLDIEKIKIRTH